MAPPTVLFNISGDFGVVGTVGVALVELERDGDLEVVVGGGRNRAHFFTPTMGLAISPNRQDLSSI